ncbi:hypothetical protein ACFVS2_22105 [Brevibacillus sp. NPDC058079]|uniref:hypothetical protein n=1 Tax=Brevibacillus sp. NPDC058079 TaxID=3346330 RepID=UPI0036E59762
MKEKMTDEEIEKFIELLRKWKDDDLTWGEFCDLRSFSYRFGDTIEKYFWNWTSE